MDYLPEEQIEESQKAVAHIDAIIGDPDRLLQKTYFEIFNSWHQKHFGMIPDYTIDGRGYYTCVLRFNVPPNDRDKWTSQIQYGYGHTRSRAREIAAELAYRFVMSNGLWTNISEAGITPDPENSINQLQELYQKKYLNVYVFIKTIY